MCGIAGIIGLLANDSTHRIEQMTQKLAHRGPDANNTYVKNTVAFGHRRLSIIDLSTGANQPFSDVSQRYTMVFNGEIYNYNEVKSLIDYPWQTTSDTEVILAAYIKWGTNCLQYLNGMFAFAIWDHQTQSLFMARDRMGVKPLYYYHHKNILVFSSEVRSMLASGLIPRQLSENGLAGYLSGMAPRTPHSIIENVYQLLPGEYAIFKEDSLTKIIYWSLVNAAKHKPEYTLTREQTIEKTRQLFEQSVQSRMVADVKVGAFLSGGIDSSAIVALMAKHSTTPIETFSITFNEKEFDESEYARIIAQKFETKHTELLLEPSKLINELDSYLSQVDSPTVDGINTWTVSKLVAQTGIKVALSGLGGDELFAGYPGFVRWKKLDPYKTFYAMPPLGWLASLLQPIAPNRATQKTLNFLKTNPISLASFYLNNRANFLDSELSRIYPISKTKNQAPWFNLNDPSVSNLPTYSQYSIGELSHYTLDVLLKDTDQMSMAWALEIREPFFDYKLIEFLLSVPDEYKYSKSTPKSLLVSAMGNLLPSEIVYRPKKGFTFPWEKWFRNELKDFCNAAINDLIKKQVFNKHELEWRWQGFLKHDKRVSWQHIWTFVMLSRWMEINQIDLE
jgi:asparagine synthase (glutamine-hydrolysing)